LQDDLAEIETYKGAGNIWLGCVASKHIPEGQGEMQEAFENTAERIRALVLKAAAADTQPKQDVAQTSALMVLGPAEDGEAEVISAVLLPTFNMLVDTHAQLIAYVAKKGVLSESELVHFYWLQFQPNQIESTLKHDGVWIGDQRHGVVPAGQASVQEQLETCHRLAYRVNTEREMYQIKIAANDMAPKNKQALKLWRDMKRQKQHIHTHETLSVCILS